MKRPVKALSLGAVLECLDACDTESHHVTLFFRILSTNNSNYDLICPF